MDEQNPTQVPPVNPASPLGTPVVEIIPPHADPQQTPPSGKFSLSPKVMLLILVILIITIVGSGIYLSKGSQPKPTPTITPTPLPTEASAKASDPTSSWKTYNDLRLNFQFNYPSKYSLTKNVDGPYPGTIDILNHNINWYIASPADVSNCRGDGCRYSTSSEVIKLGNNSINKVIGLIGAVGGNIPQNYVDYEIPIPNSTKAVLFRIHELPSDVTYQELLKQYPDSGRILQEIPKTEIDTLEKILSTFKFTEIDYKSKVPVSTPYAIISSSKISPNSSFGISELLLGDNNQIAIKDSGGNTIEDDLVAKNKDIIFNKKFNCQCGGGFEGWTNDSQFVLKINNSYGEEFEFLVDAATANVSGASFRRVK